MVDIQKATTVEIDNTEDLEDSFGARVIRPAAGVLLDDNQFQMQDVGKLARALIDHTEGRLDQLREAAKVLEARIRKRAEESHGRIDSAIQMSDSLIKERLEQVQTEAEAIKELQFRRGFEEGHERGLVEGREKGQREGLEQGLTEGREKGERELRKQLESKIEEDASAFVAVAEKIARDLEVQAKELLRDSHRDLLSLALGVAERVLRREVRQVPEAVTSLVEAAIDRIADRHSLVVEVHPADLGVASAHVERLKSSLGEGTKIRVTEVDDLGRGGCRVRSGAASVDLSVETQLEIISRRLLEASS